MYKEKATLVFDIETIPDINKAKQIYNLDNLTDEDRKSTRLLNCLNYKFVWLC